jgi:hypothetical protein
MRITRVLSLLVLFSTIPFYSSASDQSARTPSVRSWEMVATTGSVNNYFGWSVAVSGNTAVVGNLTGQVYVYEKPASGWGNMVQTAQLSSTIGEAFGPFVAISGNNIVVGGGFSGGYAYVFVRPPGGWTNMTETALLSDGLTGDGFGNSVAIGGDTIVVGATGTEVNGNQNQGSAYVFVKPAAGWATTSAYNAQLTSTDGTSFDLFGVSVGVSGSTIVVGAPYHDDQTGPGAAYVYVQPEAGWTSMTQTAELTESVQGPYDSFGIAVAIAGNTIVAGASQANNDAGAAYVFVEPPTGWTNMTESAELTTSEPLQHVGYSLGVSGKQVAVGGTGIDILVYAEPETGWQSTSIASLILKSGQPQAQFGYSVAIGSGVVVAGTPDQTVKGAVNQGAAFGFELTPP